MNTDLEHMFSITRRPTPRLAKSIGNFEYFYLILLVASIITNSHLLAFNSKIIFTWSGLFDPEVVKNAMKIEDLNLLESK